MCDNPEKKHAGNDTTIFDTEVVAITNKLLEYKCITPTQHKKVLIIFYLL